jgi:hypothetical protein
MAQLPAQRVCMLLMPVVIVLPMGVGEPVAEVFAVIFPEGPIRHGHAGMSTNRYQHRFLLERGSGGCFDE